MKYLNESHLMAMGMMGAMAFGPSLHAAGHTNVLFIAVDDMRNETSWDGLERAITPNLDRLRERGVTFNRAYCQQPLCSPSRVSIMTGLRPDTTRAWNLTKGFRDVPGVVSLPEYFKEHGYISQNIGKVYHNWREDGHADYPASWSLPPIYHTGTHGGDRPQVEGALPKNYAGDNRVECRDVPDNAYYDGRIAVAAAEAIRGFSATPDQPFFLAVGFWKPHLPFNAPKRYWDLYDRESIPLPDPGDAPLEVPLLALENGDEFTKFAKDPELLGPEAVRELRHGYLACISYMDAMLGKVIDELDRTGLADDTVIVFWSDHGFHLGEHATWAKCTTFELDARVPLIIARPDGKNGGKTAQGIVELLDLYPTLVDLCGLPPRPSLEGCSMAPLLENPASSIKELAFTQHPRPAYYRGKPEQMGYSVRSDHYRYTEWRDWKTGEVVARELYDHDTDPKETRNVVSDVNLAAVVKNHELLLRTQTPVATHR